MTRRNKILVPEAKDGLKLLKGVVMAEKGYKVDFREPEKAKHEVATNLNINLIEGYNGRLKSKEAGQIGGFIGGKMVKKMVQYMEQELVKNK